MSGPEAPPCDNLYVSNLPDVVDDLILREIFGANVVSTKILPPKDGSTTRVALVKFSSVDEASKKREELQGGVIEGYSTPPLSIRYAGKPWEQQQGGGWQQDWGWQGGYGKAPSSVPLGGLIGSSPYGGKGGGGSDGGTRDLTNLYVKGLPADIDEAWVREQFSAYGQTVTQCKVQPSTVAGQPWHAMVRFASKEDAAAAKEQFQGADSGSGQLQIDYVFKKNPDMGKGGGGKADSGWGGKPDFGFGFGGKGDFGFGFGGKGGKDDKGKGKGKGKLGMNQVLKAVQAAKFLPGAGLSNNDNCLYLSGLPPDCEDVHLWKLCAPFGAIIQSGVWAMKDPSTGLCKGIGFVNYVEDISMQQAAMTLNGLDLGAGNVLKAQPKK